MKDKWILKSGPTKVYRHKFRKYSPFIQTILFRRGIKTTAEARSFFEWDYEKGSNDCRDLLDMGKAVKRIDEALVKKEKIAVYGDYDADGVTAASILYQLFKELGADPVVYIPERVKEGYGLNEAAGRYLIKKGVKLVVTVDTGVRNVTEVASFSKRGMDVVITDHHVPPKKLPAAVAVIDPHRAGEKYPFRELSGAGVAFKLAQALIRELGEKRFSPGFEKWLLDLVGVGTIADLVPLKGENRVLAKYGLIVLGKTRRLGFRALLEKAGLDARGGAIKSGEVAFQIAPRINAAGRMDHANNAFVLLNEERSANAKKLADQLEKQNRKRQDLTAKIFTEIEKQDFSKQKIIIAGKKDWPLGVLGLVAGRLTDKYHRPALVYNINGTEVRGSARSIAEFNIVKALDSVKDILTEYGGHSQAAGFTFHKKDLKDFRRRLETRARKRLKKEDLVKKLELDYEVSFAEICNGLLEEWQALEPFGVGNEEPVFLLKGAEIKSLKQVGAAGKHLKLGVADPEKGHCLGAIGFGLGEQADEFAVGDQVDIVFNLMCNCFNGSEYLELRVRDLRKQ